MNRELSLLGLASKAGKLAIGDEAVSGTIRHGKARLVVIASDAAANTKRRFELDPGENHCKRVEIPATKAELGGALGRSTCAVCALCDIGFAASFLRILTAAYPEDMELKALYEKVNTRSEEINAARREKRKEEKAAERAASKPWSSQPKQTKKSEPKKEKNDYKKSDKAPYGEKKSAFSYKKVYGKPGPVRDENGKARKYEKGDAKKGSTYSGTSHEGKSYGKSQGKGGFSRAGSFIGKNNGGYKPYYGEGKKKSRS